MSLKSRKNKLINDVTDRVTKKIYNLLEDRFDDLDNKIAEVANDSDTLSDHVDELESEFRHEVHEIQDNAIDRDSLTDDITYVINDWASYNLSDYLKNEGVVFDNDIEDNSEDVRNELQGALQELRDIGETLRYIG
jgi:hypothetical protein